MPDVLVLGADGFIGSHVCEVLAGQGLTVRAFDRFSDGQPRNLPSSPRIRVFAGDFLDRRDVERAVDGVRVVVHLVSTTTPASSSTDPVFDVNTNVRGSIELFEACVKASVQRVVFASTGGAIYGGESARPFRETDTPSPISPYAVGKLAIEGYLRFYRQARGLESVALRISNPYGERQSPGGAQGVVPIFLARMMRGEPITVFGDGSMVRDYIYIRDLATAIARVVTASTKHPVYNVGSGRALTVLELLDRLHAASGIIPRVVHEADRSTDVRSVTLDSTRFEAEFGACAVTALDEGLKRTAEYVRQQLSIVPSLETPST